MARSCCFTLLFFVTLWTSSWCEDLSNVDLQYQDIINMLESAGVPQSDIRGPPPAPESPSILPSPLWMNNVGQLPFGQVSGVSLDQQGNLYVLHRADRLWGLGTFNSSDVLQDQTPIDSDVILKMDSKSGKLLDSWGKGLFYLPHGITVDEAGNIWITDVGSHQVLMFKSGEKTPHLTLGEQLVPGDDTKHFCKPTSVAVASNGVFYVADGYCNARILKYSEDGKLLKEWGKGSGALSVFMGDSVGTGTFNTPHGLALAEDRDLLCVADRENSRIQCFTAGVKDNVGDDTGTFKYEIDDKQLGRVYDIAYHPDNGGLLYAVSGRSFVGRPRPAHGSVISLETKEIVDTWIPEQGFDTPHTIAVSHDDSALFVGETNPSGGILWKFVSAEEAFSELANVEGNVEGDDEVVHFM